MMIKPGYYYTDLSKLYRAWENYYTQMGLSYNKKLKKVIERVRKRKFPEK
jgi:hypothetical protein